MSATTTTATKSTPCATVGLLSLPSAPANLHAVYKTFTLTPPSIDKINPTLRYAVSIRRL